MVHIINVNNIIYDTASIYLYVKHKTHDTTVNHTTTILPPHIAITRPLFLLLFSLWVYIYTYNLCPCLCVLLRIPSHFISPRVSVSVSRCVIADVLTLPILLFQTCWTCWRNMTTVSLLVLDDASMLDIQNHNHRILGECHIGHEWRWDDLRKDMQQEVYRRRIYSSTRC